MVCQIVFHWVYLLSNNMSKKALKGAKEFLKFLQTSFFYP